MTFKAENLINFAYQQDCVFPSPPAPLPGVPRRGERVLFLTVPQSEKMLRPSIGRDEINRPRESRANDKEPGTSLAGQPSSRVPVPAPLQQPTGSQSWFARKPPTCGVQSPL